MASESFVGIWRLVSYELRRADGRVTYPMGKDATGYIMYNDIGYMSVVIMAAGRPKFSAEVAQAGTDTEKVRAFDTYLSYCGKYEVKGSKVIHHVEISFYPNWVGTDLERTFEFESDRLTLSAPTSSRSGAQYTARLVWQRVKTKVTGKR
jgi:hypothetical protein